MSRSTAAVPKRCFSVFEFGAIALSVRNAVTESSLAADGSTEGLLTSRRGRLKPIVRQGDPSPLGGKIGGLVGDDPVSVSGRTLVFAASLTDGAPVVQALFAETGGRSILGARAVHARSARCAPPIPPDPVAACGRSLGGER